MNPFAARLIVALAPALWFSPLTETPDGTRKRKDRTRARRRPHNWRAKRRARMRMARASRRGNR